MPTKSGHTNAILASKVVGTPVYAAGGEKLGHIQDIMLNKLSDHLAFAVLTSLGTSGIDRYLPIPWLALDYEPSAGGYVIRLSEQQMRTAPVFGLDELAADDGIPARELMRQFYRKSENGI